jgi:hypothetical protein
MPRLPLLGVLLTAAVPAALAQPNPDAPPAAGTVTLESGFSPDPHAVELTAGGPVEAAAASPECMGYVTAAPSVVLDYGGSDERYFHLYVRSDTDTVLLVRTPGGAWLCNDDFEGPIPAVHVDAPEAGRYAVWVGTYAGDTDVPATLYASEIAMTRLDPEGEPTSGTADLGAGFTPDPHEVTVTAGGPIPLFGVEGCYGYMDPAAPTFVLRYDADGSGPLYVYVEAGGGEDLTLAVMAPDGTVHCNDDAMDLNPGLVVEPAAAGRYAVWVGSYGEAAAPIPATLFFSATGGPTGEYIEDDYYEDDYYEDGAYEGGEDISLFAAPAHGTLTLAPGFAPEEVAVEAGGGDAVSVFGSGCAGYIANGEPDLNVLFGEGVSALAFYAESEDDTTLLVNLPDGSWRCSDDEVGRNPGLEIEAPEGGLYNVWVGTYAQGGGAPATLHVATRIPR